MEYKHKRRVILGFLILLLIFLYIFQNVSGLVKATGSILAVLTFYFIDKAFKIDFKLQHYFYVLIMLILGIIFSPIYFIYSIYDKFLHFTIPIFISILLFYVIDRLDIKFQWKLLMTFMSLLSLLTIFEIGEYLLDILFNLKLQGVYIMELTRLQKYNLVQARIDDTMIDIILGIFGAGVFALGKTITHFYKRKKQKTKS